MSTAAPTSAVAEVLSGLPGIRPWLEETYRWLHAHPELSTQEHGTAARVLEEVRAMPGAQDLEILAGLIESGEPLTDLLRRKSSSEFHRAELKQWLLSDPTAPREERSALITERWRKSSGEITERLGFSREAAERAIEAESAGGPA